MKTLRKMQISKGIYFVYHEDENIELDYIDSLASLIEESKEKHKKVNFIFDVEPIFIIKTDKARQVLSNIKQPNVKLLTEIKEFCL